MRTKDKNIKTISTKNNTHAVSLPAEKVAEITGVSESTVKKVRNGLRSKETPQGAKVAIVDDLYSEGSNKLITEIKRIVNL